MFTSAQMAMNVLQVQKWKRPLSSKHTFVTAVTLPLGLRLEMWNVVKATAVKIHKKWTSEMLNADIYMV